VRGHVLAVSVAAPAEHRWLGRTIRTSIFKQRVTGPVAARGVTLEGDEQADRDVHGGPDKAVYAYAAEDLDWWSGELERPVEPGSMGENLTLAGIDVSAAVVGETWRVGGVVFEVRQPRLPCLKLGLRMGDRLFPQRFSRALRPGAYLAIRQEGELATGDEVAVIDRPGHGVTVGLVAAAYHRDRGLATSVLDAPQLTEDWRRWARGTR
jgi:MOSC domain-containing protein YiiM